ncbi:MAG: PQQ-binding-like beta-propeller repeat protein [Propioniciclava sp.]
MGALPPEPRRPFRPWLAWLLVLGMAGASAAGSTGTGVPVNTATGLVGADGSRQVTTIDGTTWMWESAHMSGGEVMGSGPPWLTLAMPDPEAAMATTWLRLTSTRWEGDIPVSEYDLYTLTTTGVEQALLRRGQETLVFDPPMMTLPADIGDGSTWSSSGAVDRYLAEDRGQLTYTSQARASRPAGDSGAAGCLDVATTVTVGSDTDSETTQWCPEIGRVAPGSPAPPPPVGPDLLEDAPSTRDPGRWSATTTLAGVDPPMLWSTSLPPVATDDLLVLAPAAQDLLLVPDDDPNRVRRVRPGGRITLLERHGDLLLAGSTTADLTAYDATSRWRWTTRLPGLVTRASARAGSRIVVADTAGHLSAIDLTDGEVHWQRTLGAAPSTDPVTCGGLTVIGTTGSEVIAFSLDGDPAWDRPLGSVPAALSCDGETVVVLASGRMDTLSAAGEQLHSVPTQDGVISAIGHLGEVVVTVSGEQVTGYRAGTHQRQWRRSLRCEAATFTDTHLACQDRSGIVLISADGEDAHRWELPESGAFPTLVTAPNGLVSISEPFRVLRIR